MLVEKMLSEKGEKGEEDGMTECLYNFKLYGRGGTYLACLIIRITF